MITFILHAFLCRWMSGAYCCSYYFPCIFAKKKRGILFNASPIHWHINIHFNKTCYNQTNL